MDEDDPLLLPDSELEPEWDGREAEADPETDWDDSDWDEPL